MQYGDAIAILRGIPLFGRLDMAKLKLLAFSSTALTFEPGEVLFHQGDPADGAYVIERGEVEVVIGDAGAEVRVGRLGQHELFGEMAIILNQTRTATIRALQPLEVLKIDADVFVRLVTENPDAALAVMRSLSERLASLTSRFQQLENRLETVPAADRID